MIQIKKPMFAALLALAVLTAAVGPAAAASPGIDNETTISASESDVQDGVTLTTDFNASADATYTIQTDGASTSDLVMNITVNQTGTQYYKFSGDWTAVNATNGQYNHSFDESDLSRVPMNINENVTLDVNVWESGDQANATTATVTIQNTDERAVREASSGASFVDVESAEAPFYRVLTDDRNQTEVDDTVSVNGSETAVVYTLASSEVLEPFEETTSELETDGAFTLMATSLDGDSTEPVPVFLNEKPDWYDESDFGSYAVYSPSEDTVQFTLSEDNFESESSADVMMNSDVYRISDLGTVWNMAGGYSGGGVDAVLEMVM